MKIVIEMKEDEWEKFSADLGINIAQILAEKVFPIIKRQVETEGFRNDLNINIAYYIAKLREEKLRW